MSNETDLDWLARNVNEWPKGDSVDGLALGCTFFDTGVCRSVHVYAADGSDYTTIKESEWLSRRAELQNKPSWKDAPEWAQWMAQDEDGEWWFFSGKPKAQSVSFDERDSGISADYAKKGETLGDWRDTLEKRPADLSEQAVTARLNEATDNVLAAVPELMTDKYKFTPFTSIEDNQEKDMKQDSGWFERGELPPVGARVNVDGPGLVYGDGERDCEVLTHVEDTAVVRMSYGLGCFQSHALSPSRTEREVAIEEMCNVAGLDGLVFGLVAGKLYDAGYRKESK
ncbi:hypothetical protein KE335_gp07 [Aeromonas phage 2_D05]|uniref:Uncharacterized protein n=1 Tax=Aeromonas phage 2_D05 TaxID=2588098 RepID=A0A4Y5TWU9_9CAUD|nr:hypothetical protein KE335_gp07 [Aeromonas phage 2_D05]QDB73838.1 hypothetical protein 2D05_007 [Aeromonas phage 2_D05]